MWVLSTDRAELHFFHAPQRVVPGYAILSHVWDATEQTFQETQALRTAGDPERGYNPRDHSSPKVREACIAAERDGYRWLWDDTCCIDKTSSSELSEAINSMFSYYAFAEVCYVYLGDVRPGSKMSNPSVPSLPSYALQRSRWFKRGWTLQELIAPAHVIFLSSDWEVMGIKTDNALVLASLTGIPRAILSLEEEIWDMSIAERMSWAAGRNTTRLEDEAYSLMGIFDVHMPTIYGEGRYAFRRLQEEIMRRSTDTSLFAWGGLLRNLPDPKNLLSFDTWRGDELYLLATSPSNFRTAAGRVSVQRNPSNSEFATSQNASSPSPSRVASIPSFEATPYGVRARMPVVEVRGFSIALLYTSYTLAGIEQPLGLLLARKPGADPARPLYHCYAVSSWRQSDGQLWTYRLLNVRDVRQQHPECEALFDDPPWQDFYLTYVRPEPGLQMERSVLSRGVTPFHVPEWLLTMLRDQGGRVQLRPEGVRLWEDDEPVRMVVSAYAGGRTEQVSISLGRCTRFAPNVGRGSHWVVVSFSSVWAIPVHNCDRDHIANWATPRLTHSVKDTQSIGGSNEIVLSFVRHQPNPIKTYALTELVWERRGNILLTTTTASSGQ